MRKSTDGVRYQFVDCRWELGKPDRGRELYLAGHVPGASFLDVDTDLSARPGRGGRHPLPDAADGLLRRVDELVVVDARTPTRYRGEPNPIDDPPGRIPGARNAPWNEPLADLPAGELVAYCGSGVTACVVLHRLQLAGREGRLYPGSWSEWEQREDLPRE